MAATQHSKFTAESIEDLTNLLPSNGSEKEKLYVHVNQADQVSGLKVPRVYTTRTNIIDEFSAALEAAPSLSCNGLVIPYAVMAEEVGHISATAITFTVVNGNKNNMVIVYFHQLDGKDQFAIRCGDNLLKGSVSGRYGSLPHMDMLYGVASNIDWAGCHFDHKAEKNILCEHTSAVLTALKKLGQAKLARIEAALKAGYGARMVGFPVGLEEGQMSIRVAAPREEPAKSDEDSTVQGVVGAVVGASLDKSPPSDEGNAEEATPLPGALVSAALTGPTAPASPLKPKKKSGPAGAGNEPEATTTKPKKPKASEFSIEGMLFRAPILIEGDRGSGKTFEVRTLARKLGVPLVELAGHASIEAWEMFGQMVPAADGSLLWKDGKLSQAFRLAQNQKVILLLDELLRIDARHLSALLTSLSPFDGCYRLSTGRIVSVQDGVGMDEILTCPVDNLAVVATTNVGAEFAVDELDPAIAERFIPIRKDTTETSLRLVLNKTLKEKSFSPTIADKMVKFFNVTRGLVSQGLLNKGPTTRTMNRALEISNNESDIPKALAFQKLLWVDRDSSGNAVTEQVKLIDDSLKAAFK